MSHWKTDPLSLGHVEVRRVAAVSDSGPVELELGLHLRLPRGVRSSGPLKVLLGLDGNGVPALATLAGAIVACVLAATLVTAWVLEPDALSGSSPAPRWQAASERAAVDTGVPAAPPSSRAEEHAAAPVGAETAVGARGARPPVMGTRAPSGPVPPLAPARRVVAEQSRPPGEAVSPTEAESPAAPVPLTGTVSATGAAEKILEQPVAKRSMGNGSKSHPVVVHAPQRAGGAEGGHADQRPFVGDGLDLFSDPR